MEHKFWVDILGGIGPELSMVMKELYPKVGVQVGLVNRCTVSCSK